MNKNGFMSNIFLLDPYIYLPVSSGIEIIGSSAYSACLDGTHKAFFNTHAVFCGIIYFVKARWDKEFSEYKSTNVTVTASGNTGSKKLVDDLISHGTKVEELLQYFKLVLEVYRHACIAVNLKKCSFFPKKVTFVGLPRLGTNQRRTSSLQSSNSR